MAHPMAHPMPTTQEPFESQSQTLNTNTTTEDRQTTRPTALSFTYAIPEDDEGEPLYSRDQFKVSDPEDLAEKVGEDPEAWLHVLKEVRKHARELQGQLRDALDNPATTEDREEKRNLNEALNKLADKVGRRDARLAERDAKLRQKERAIEGLNERLVALQEETTARAVHSEVVDKLEEQIVVMMQLADNADPSLFARKYGLDDHGLPKTPGKISYAEFRKRALKRPVTTRKLTPRVGNAKVDQLLGESSEDEDDSTTRPQATTGFQNTNFQSTNFQTTNVPLNDDLDDRRGQRETTAITGRTMGARSAAVMKALAKNIKLPPTFNGDREGKSAMTFSEWKDKMSVFLEANDEIEDEDAVRVVYQNTSGPAYDRLKPHKLDFRTAKDVFKMLDDSYGTHHEKKTHREAFRRLTHRTNQAFDDFNADFTKHTAYLGLDDEELQEQMREKIQPYLGRPLAGQKFGSLMEMRQRLRDIEIDLRGYQRNFDANRTTFTGAANATHSELKNKDSREGNEGAGAGRVARAARLGANIEKEYDWTKAGEKYKPLEVWELNKEKHCWACHISGHTKYDSACRLAPFKKWSPRQKRINNSAAKVSTPTPDSGKE